MSSATSATLNVAIEPESIIDVSLLDIFTDHWPNNRKRMDISKLRELYDSIRVNGLNQNLQVTVREGGGVDIVAGWRRLRACRAVAVYNLVREINKLDPVTGGVEFPKKKAKDGTESFVIFDALNDDHWNLLYRQKKDEVDACLREYKVKAKVLDNIKDTTDASLANHDENNNRVNVPVLDLCGNIADLCSGGVKQAYIAKRLGLDTTKVSQIVKVGEMPATIRALLIDHPDIPVEGLPQHKEHVDTVINELTRRMGIHEKDEDGKEYLSWSSCILLANFVTAKDPNKGIGCTVVKAEGDTPETLIYNSTVTTTLDMLRKLLRIDDNFKTTNEPTTDYTSFKKLLDNCRHQRDAELKRRNGDDDVSAGTDAQAAKVADDVMAAANEIAGGGSAPAAKPAATPSANAKASPAADAAAANTADDINAQDDTIIGDEMTEDELMASADVETITGEAALPDQQAAAKARGDTTQAVVSRYKPMEFSAVESIAVEACTIANDAETDPIDRIVNISNASLAYGALGMRENAKVTNEQFIAYCDAIKTYWDATQGFITEMAKLGHKFPLSVPGVDAMKSE